MKQHFVYFFGSTNLSSNISKRNQIIGFEGIDINQDLIENGELCLNKVNEDGTKGETGTMYPKNITIVPFRYMYDEALIIRQLEDVISANENYIKAESIGFPLMMLSSATAAGYSQLGRGADLSFVRERENEFKNEWCCFGHYYLYLLKKALHKKGYVANGVLLNEKSGNLINKEFTKSNGMNLIIHADAGL